MRIADEEEEEEERRRVGFRGLRKGGNGGRVGDARE
jgi:hypothetical protein